MPSSPRTSASFLPCLVSALVLLFASAPCHAQQDYIGRYDVYTGFADLNTPGLDNINQPGFHLQTGVQLTRSFIAGFDYINVSGSSVLTTAIATPALRQQLAAELPPGYVLSLPFSARIQTFAAGGQFISHHFHHATLSARPVLAAFHIHATPQPTDPINTLVAAQLAPAGYLTDWYGAYGGGGGVELPITRHIGARTQLDAAWSHPFTNLLDHGSFSFRYSVGPAFHFGHNLAH